MVDFFQYFWGPIFNTVLGGVTAYCVARYRAKTKADDAMADGIRSLLRNAIIEGHRRFVIKHEEMTVDDVDGLNQSYQSYHGLKGNGLATKLVEEINSAYAEGANKHETHQ